jgi:PKD repeat protein
MIVPMFLSSCKKDNYAPVAFADVSPVSGVAPLSSRIKGYGTDSKGVDDIKLYDLNINGKDSTSNSPFDFVKVFSTPGTYNIFVVVTDSHGATSKSKVVTVDVSSTKFNAPVASLTVDKTSGDSPLNVRFKVSGTDKDNDISSYRLYLDGKVDSSSVPIDTSMTFFPGTHSVYAEVVDKHKLSNATSTTTINIFAVGSWMNQFPLPKGRVNLFMPDSTQVEYNGLKTKLDRDNYLSVAAANDICARIPIATPTINGIRYVFLCVESSVLFQYNRHDWLDLYNEGKKNFGGYTDEVLDSMYVHSGTGKFRNTSPAPVFTADVSPSHMQVYAVSGDDLSGSSLNLIEEAKGLTNLQPGQEGVAFTYPDFTLYYAYTYKDALGRNSLANIPIVKYSVENGMFKFLGTNPNLDVILERDFPPVLNVSSPVNGKTYSSNSKILLDEVTVGKTFRYGYYSFDGGVTKTAINQRDKKDLIYNGNRYFSAGNYTLSLYVKNEFFEDASKTINFTVK